MTTTQRERTPIRIALVGLGKIARDQHLSALSDNEAFTLAATVDPTAPRRNGVPHFNSLEALFGSDCPFDAAAVCTPPQARYAIALRLLDARKHVLLEKPPTTTLSEIGILQDRARASRTTLFAAWHSRYAEGVGPAREWLADKRLERVEIVWREDVHVWHPGQHWIWQPGGFGVFDPGINALSIATDILPRPLRVTESALQFPANCEAPVAAQVQMEDSEGLEVRLDLDFRQRGPQTWTITVETDGGQLQLSEGGRVLTTPDGIRKRNDNEYPSLYRHFAAVVREGKSHVDVSPLRLVSDALLRGSITRVGNLIV